MTNQARAAIQRHFEARRTAAGQAYAAADARSMLCVI